MPSDWGGSTRTLFAPRCRCDVASLFIPRTSRTPARRVPSPDSALARRPRSRRGPVVSFPRTRRRTLHLAACGRRVLCNAPPWHPPSALSYCQSPFCADAPFLLRCVMFQRQSAHPSRPAFPPTDRDFKRGVPSSIIKVPGWRALREPRRRHPCRWRTHPRRGSFDLRPMARPPA